MGYCRQHRQLESQYAIQDQAFSPSVLTQHGTLLPAALSGKVAAGTQTGKEHLLPIPTCAL